jgi:catechol 2,3-dioxygenase-like lactoylglutathione lyase family enzyme
MTPIDPGPAGIFRELHAVIVPVRDLAASLAWYRETLGLEPRRVEEGFLAVLGTGGPTHVCLYVPEDAEDGTGEAPAGSFPNFRTDDIDAAHAHLVGHGVRCTEVARGGPLAFFTFHDPDGNRIDVCEYGPAWLS